LQRRLAVVNDLHLVLGFVLRSCICEAFAQHDGGAQVNRLGDVDLPAVALESSGLRLHDLRQFFLAFGGEDAPQALQHRSDFVIVDPSALLLKMHTNKQSTAMRSASKHEGKARTKDTLALVLELLEEELLEACCCGGWAIWPAASSSSTGAGAEAALEAAAQAGGGCVRSSTSGCAFEIIGSSGCGKRCERRDRRR
jgi:hypothetical protein